MDELPPNTNWNQLDELINAAIPEISNLSSAFNSSFKPLQLSAKNIGSVTINTNPQYVQALNSIVAQEIEGDIHLTNEDRQIIQLIHQYAPEREAELSSAVRELADESASHTDRLSSKQKLKVFLSGLGNAVQGMAIDVLKSYIDKQLGL